MKSRIQAGTDIAKIGAWDAGRKDAVLAGKWGKQFDQVIEDDCSAGALFVIYTGGDGGGPIDVYVDEPAPDGVRKQFSLQDGEFLLSIPSGRMLVGGLEDYRSGQSKVTGPDSV